MRLLPRHAIVTRWRASTFDDRLGLLLVLLALVVSSSVGSAQAFSQPVYGPIDEVSHTAYAFHVGKYGVPPVLGRDRAFIGRRGVALGSRDVDIPNPEAGSAPIPIGNHGVYGQPEAIQPPLYYYVVAPLTWFGTGDAVVVAMRLAGVALVAASVVLAFVAVIDLTGDGLASGFAAIVLATLSGVTDFLSEVQNDALLLPLGGAIFWLLARGLRSQRLTWPFVCCASAIAVTHVVAIPMAALAVLALGIAQLRTQPTGRLRIIGRIVAAGVPLACWIASNEIRYGSIFPHNVLAGASSLFKAGNTQFLHLHELSLPVFNSILGGGFLHLQASPFAADYRPMAILVPIFFIGTGVICARGSSRVRAALGYCYGMVGLSLVTIFCSVAASLIGTGGDLAAIQIHRYYMPVYFGAACLLGIAAGGIASNAQIRRVLVPAAAAALVYWSINGSTLT